MSLRDLVTGECAEPTAVTRMANNFYDNKFQFQDGWVPRGGIEAGEGTQSRIRRPTEDILDEDDLDDEMGDYFKGIDGARPTSGFDLDEYQNFNEDLQERRQPDMPPLDMQPGAYGALGSLLKNFIHSKNFMGRFEELPDLGLSERDKAKIRDRAGVMSRHFNADRNQDLADEQMEYLLNSLHIDNRRAEERSSEDMERIWQQTAPSTRPASSWATEYRERSLNEEGDEYVDMLNNTTYNQEWMEENLQRAPAEHWADEYRKGESSQWVHDYTTKTDAEIEAETLEDAWNDGAHERIMKAAWSEREREMKNGGNLTELTDAITRIDDPKLQASNFMKFMHKINRGQVTFEDNQVIDRSDSMPLNTGIVDDWLTDYEAEREEDFGYHDPRDWQNEYAQFTGSIAPDRLPEYEFVVNNASNPYATHEDPYQAGVELFNEGRITESILALEAEVQRNPGNSMAWLYLGQAHAENDKDGQAIVSLEKAVQVDPQNLEALAALAVSYTNDFNREKALDVLETWLLRSQDYSHIPAAHPADGNERADFYTEPWGRHSRVAEMFLEAAQQRPNDPDPEVQTALGLLYNLSYEYERAVDCFKAALTKRPSDYRLWNKLGATLANSNRSEEALGAYFKALEGKPTYVRARANLGISFLALNSYQEAAQSFLSALRLHPNANHLWDNLKMVFRLMGRDDLEERAAANDVNVFGDEFTY